MCMEEEKTPFPCPKDFATIVTTDDCTSCNRRRDCDIYATMLDEE
jgi:hypothetical protein